MKIQATACVSPLEEERFEPQGRDAGSDHRICSNNTRLPSDVEAQSTTRGWWGSFEVCYKAEKMSHFESTNGFKKKSLSDVTKGADTSSGSAARSPGRRWLRPLVFVPFQTCISSRNVSVLAGTSNQAFFG